MTEIRHSDRAGLQPRAEALRAEHAVRQPGRAFRGSALARRSRTQPPARPAPLWIDLGCGKAKTDGFVGVDRFPLPEVDLVTDLDRPFPLADDSVSELLASHSLEHLQDLVATMKEIWRVCEDRALVTIVSPYFNTRLNEANPYHLVPFNEHTARFFTNAVESLVPLDEYDFPLASTWGTGQSDNSAWAEDFRVLKMEFFYMPPYRGLPEDAKRLLRKSISDVCDQFVLRLLVVKSPVSDHELRDRAERTYFRDTEALAIRRRLEAEVGPPNAFGTLTSLPQTLAEMRSAQAETAEMLAADRQTLTSAIAQSSRAFEELTPLPAAVARLERHADDNLQRIDALSSELERSLAENADRGARSAELDALHAAVTSLSLEASERERAVRGLSEALAAALAESGDTSAQFAPLPAAVQALEAQAAGHEARLAELREAFVAASAEQADRRRELGELSEAVSAATRQSSHAFAELQPLPGLVRELQARAEASDQTSVAFAESLNSIAALAGRRADEAQTLVTALAETTAAGLAGLRSDLDRTSAELARTATDQQATAESVELVFDVVEGLERAVAAEAARVADLQSGAERVQALASDAERLSREVSSLQAGLDEFASLPGDLTAIRRAVADARHADDSRAAADRRETSAALAQLGAEQARAFEAIERLADELPRLDHLDRLYDHLDVRSAASHSEAVRRALALEARLLALAMRTDREHARSRDAGRTAFEGLTAQTARTEAVAQKLTAVEIARERSAFAPLRYARNWIARGRDHRGLAPADHLDRVRSNERVQLGCYWRVGDGDQSLVATQPGRLVGLDLAAWAFLAPATAIHGLEFVISTSSGTPVAEGACAVEPDVGGGPLRLRFAPVEVDGQSLTLRLFAATPSVEAAGLKLFEARVLHPLTRRVRRRQWLAKAVYA